MKLIKLLIAICIVTGAASCKKNQLTSVNISNDDVAIILGSSLATNNYGMNYLSTDISSTVLANTNLSCGALVTDSMERKSFPGSVATYSYKLKYTHKLNCNTDNLPDNFNSTLTFAGNFNGPRVSFTNSGNTNYRIAGLTPSATVHVFNGEYKSSGTFKLKSDTTNTGTANIYLGVKNLIISKANHNIMSGTAMVIVTGTSTKKPTFTYNGTLTFNSAFSALLTLNGNDYTIDLTTGEVVKK